MTHLFTFTPLSGHNPAGPLLVLYLVNRNELSQYHFLLERHPIHHVRNATRHILFDPLRML